MTLSDYTPKESQSDLWTERYNFAGAILGGVAYGM